MRLRLAFIVEDCGAAIHVGGAVDRRVVVREVEVDLPDFVVSAMANPDCTVGIGRVVEGVAGA